MAQVVWNWSVGPVVISGLERLLDGATDAFRSRRRIFGIVARSGAQENQPSSATKSRSWIFAGLAALLIAAGWYVTTKLW
jgi:hypothetical protein